MPAFCPKLLSYETVPYVVYHAVVSEVPNSPVDTDVATSFCRSINHFAAFVLILMNEFFCDFCDVGYTRATSSLVAAFHKRTV